MHDSVRVWVRSLAARIPFKGDALEVGSLDENGSVRPILEPLMDSYVGIDMREGRRVDVVMDANDLLSVFTPRTLDLVVCCEMLEHAQDWKRALFNMKQLVSDEGYFILTTRGPGFPRHAYPDDYWRFTPDLMRKAMGDMRLSTVVEDTDPASPGVFVLAVGPSQVRHHHEDPALWHDAEEVP